MSTRVVAKVVGGLLFRAARFKDDLVGVQLFVDVGGVGPAHRCVVEERDPIVGITLLRSVGWSGEPRDGRLFDLPESVIATITSDIAGRTIILSLQPAEVSS